MKNSIDNDLKKYVTKGEFEKTTDFQDRIKDENLHNAFEEIVSKWILEYSNYKNISVDKYDADKELYYISIFSGASSDTKSFAKYAVKIPVSEAKEFSETVWNYGKNYKVKPDISSKINLTEDGGLMYDKLLIEINGKIYKSELIESNKPIIFNLKDFIAEKEYQFNFTAKNSTTSQSEKDFVGLWNISNTFIQIKDDRNVKIFNYGKQEDGEGNEVIGFYKTFEGNWSMNNNTLTLDGKDAEGSFKKLHLYIISLSKNKIIFSYTEDKKSPIELSFITESQLAEFQKQAKIKIEKKQRKDELLNTGKSILKSILK